MEIIGLVVVAFFIFGFMSYITGYKLNPEIISVNDNTDDDVQVDWLNIKNQTPLADEIITIDNKK